MNVNRKNQADPQTTSRRMLGCQIWLEREMAPDRIDHLFGEAAEAGLGWGRIFLIWPWIEPRPNEWHFEIFDVAFAAAERYDLRIKATLTANSGPWHIGTPSSLHSFSTTLSEGQRPAMRRYIHACVERYTQHPALGQWVLWNEPSGGYERTDESRRHWQQTLAKMFDDDIDRLNTRWRTGYERFDEIPFPEDVAHPVHAKNLWNSYGPWLADWWSRSQWLNAELSWVKSVVREIDATTPTCVNPTMLVANQAAGGTDLEGMGALADVIGASYHPAWGFGFAARDQFAAVMAAGVRHQAAFASVRAVEVTEVQCGNTATSGTRPSDATPGEIARFFLASLFAGAQSVIGWSLNAREGDFEAGDWGLLDDMDRAGPRSRMVRRVQEVLAVALEATGGWTSAPAQIWLGMSPHAQALEWIESRCPGASVVGRQVTDNVYGNLMLAVHSYSLGYAATIAPLDTLPSHAREGEVLVLSHVLAWEADDAGRILEFVRSGGTLVMDAMSGRKDFDAKVHRPWPGFLAEALGFRATGLESRPNGYAIECNGGSAGTWALTRLRAELAQDAGWKAWEDMRFALDGEACIWERRFGNGRVIIVRGLLGPSLVHDRSNGPMVRSILKRAVSAEPTMRPVYPASSFTIPVCAERGRLFPVFCADLIERQAQPLRVHTGAGQFTDLWSGVKYDVRDDGEVALDAQDGVALLWSEK